MNSTGIIRRIDDLGRVVVPKEIRRTLNISEGDPLKIFVQDGMVCYKKYIPESGYIETVKSMTEILEQDIDINIDTKIKLKSKLKEIISILDVTKTE
jgi:transcriptional pleiotropic regulator of transition state genes